MLNPIEINRRPLVVPTHQEVVESLNIAVMQDELYRAWRPPDLMVDLSGRDVAPDLMLGTKLKVHGTYVGTYEQTYLFGFHHLHAILSPSGEFNCQEIANYEGRIEYHLNNRPPAKYVIPDFERVEGALSVSFDRLSPDNVTRLNGPTFFGSPIEPANWGMWLLNGIESAYSFVAAGQPGRYLCYAPEPWQKGLLKFVGVRDEKINQQLPWQTYLCEELAVHQYTHIDLIPNDMSKAVFGNIVSRCVKSPETPEFEKIFISRLSFTKKLGGNYRALLNEQELIAALQGRGYQIVEPQNLPFEDQVRIFNRAKIVVGLGGAGMFNAVFCKPKTKIVSIESTGTFALNHARLFWGLELQYGFIFGRDNREENRFPHNSWSIDVNKTINALVSFE